MAQRIAALSFIFICTTIAWMFLGSTIADRTYTLSPDLKSQVASSWGTEQNQSSPKVQYEHKYKRDLVDTISHKNNSEDVSETLPIELEASKLDVTLDLQHRQKGLLWYSTYSVYFLGNYQFSNPTDEKQLMTFILRLPAEHAVYDDLSFTANGVPLKVSSSGTWASASMIVDPRHLVSLDARYHSQGLDAWRYSFGEGVTQMKNFNLVMHTNFDNIDFPESTLSPTAKLKTDKGWDLQWNYKNLVSGFAIGMIMPEKLQPGPLAGQISHFAPVSLFFFFFIIAMITTLRGIDLHPMNYFFLAAAFFAFHLLLAYLVDHISIHKAFVICSIVSIFLVVSYLRLVVGLRFAALEAGVAQLIYLVLFSYAFFFKGFTGLAVTIGLIVTLFAVMQVTGRMSWTHIFARVQGRPVPPPAAL